ncbi:hypothetical protein EHQ99_10785 [Leptospira bouyouniensis]|uniref:Uncharacterized protein n=1 Tax=Leptospira bouyouniensis TaxID=2484911 RepID=A0ABY2L239_9LEPT|nr:hypothetical protein EHQ10_17250 [Leptospira bouyouniensis]TGM81161.1 hypothetical protein EHQ99_10785 [Leptospira bouyouniensis]
MINSLLLFLCENGRFEKSLDFF